MRLRDTKETCDEETNEKASEKISLQTPEMKAWSVQIECKYGWVDQLSYAPPGYHEKEPPEEIIVLQNKQHAQEYLEDFDDLTENIFSYRLSSVLLH